MTLDTGASFTINGALAWTQHGPWQFITAKAVGGTVLATATAVGNWPPTWAMAGIGATGVGASS